MPSQKFLPPDVEEDLAQAAGVLVRSGILGKVKLDDILKKIAKEMNLSHDHRKALHDPDWLRKFKNRWSHKLSPGERHFADSFPGLPRWQSQFNKKDEERSVNGILSPKHSNLKITCLKTNGVLEKFPMTSNFSHKRSQHKEPQFLCTRKSWNTSLPKASSTSRQISNELAEDVKKKAQMGLRIHVKPIERLSYDGGIKSQKETGNELGSHCSQDECSNFDGPPGSRRNPTHDLDDVQRKKGSVFKHGGGRKRRGDNAEEMLDSDEDSSGKSTRRSFGSPTKIDSGSRLAQKHKTLPSEEGIVETDCIPGKKKKRDPKHGEQAKSDEETSTPTHATSVKENAKLSVNNRKTNFSLVRSGLLKLEDLCLACGTTENVIAKHPLFLGGLCQEHKLLMHESFFQYDDDGYHSVCSVCCMGNKVVLCDIQDCVRCYCKNCLNTLTHSNCFKGAVNSKRWVCNFCVESRDAQDLLIRRPEWKEEIQRLYQNTGESRFVRPEDLFFSVFIRTVVDYSVEIPLQPAFLVPSPIPVQSRRPIRVLSLFDGIATGIVALKQLGLEIKTFVASEIDEDAIRLVQNKHPGVTHIGDVTKITDEEIFKMGPFDLLLGGSPCNDLSGANPRRRGLLDAEGSGCLFFDFYRILRTIEPPRSRDGGYKRPFFWLFENVVSMKGIEKERISRFLQCEPKMADARYVSAAARPRLFWGNLPGLRDRKIVPGVKDHLTVQECLEPNRIAQVEKLNTITTKYTCLYQGVARRAPVLHNSKKDVLWTTELERVFGVPEHYTDVNNLGPRERLALLGRSWSVPVVRLLLAPLKEYFSGVHQVPEGQKCTSGKWWS